MKCKYAKYIGVPGDVEIIPLNFWADPNKLLEKGRVYKIDFITLPGLSRVTLKEVPNLMFGADWFIPANIWEKIISDIKVKFKSILN